MEIQQYLTENPWIWVAAAFIGFFVVYYYLTREKVDASIEQEYNQVLKSDEFKV